MELCTWLTFELSNTRGNYMEISECYKSFDFVEGEDDRTLPYKRKSQDNASGDTPINSKRVKLEIKETPKSSRGSISNIRYQNNSVLTTLSYSRQQYYKKRYSSTQNHNLGRANSFETPHYDNRAYFGEASGYPSHISVELSGYQSTSGNFYPFWKDTYDSPELPMSERQGLFYGQHPSRLVGQEYIPSFTVQGYSPRLSRRGHRPEFSSRGRYRQSFNSTYSSQNPPFLRTNNGPPYNWVRDISFSGQNLTVNASQQYYSRSGFENSDSRFTSYHRQRSPHQSRWFPRPRHQRWRGFRPRNSNSTQRSDVGWFDSQERYHNLHNRGSYHSSNARHGTYNASRSNAQYQYDRRTYGHDYQPIYNKCFRGRYRWKRF